MPIIISTSCMSEQCVDAKYSVNLRICCVKHAMLTSSVVSHLFFSSLSRMWTRSAISFKTDNKIV